MPVIASIADWKNLSHRLASQIPEAFGPDGRALNLIEGEWQEPGFGRHYESAIDGRSLGRIPMLDLDTALRAVKYAKSEAQSWAPVDLDERKLRVLKCIEGLRRQRELIALLLIWEIGKPYAQALMDVDRCMAGVEWYIENIEAMLGTRQPLGLISNIASWNYPMSVLMHAVLVQVLAGNAVISKTPTDGSLYALTLAHAIARRAGLPVSLVSGSGGQLSEALVRNEHIDCLAFVGGKTNGGAIAASLYDDKKRYILEMEGVNTYGIWEFSDWANLAQQLRKGFDYGKQRCTAYVRFIVQRALFPQFLEMYLPMLRSLRFGNPVLVEYENDPLPKLDFGPLINSKKVEELRVLYTEALGKGAISLSESTVSESMIFPNQDTSAYVGAAALLNIPRNTKLYHNEPFGPIDTIVVVDHLEELITEMNVSNGCLVSSIACDRSETARRVAGELRAFKVGINTIRSRGDREEVFGGIGQSWKGCFVGGRLLVSAVTQGEAGEKLYGNFPDYTLLPEEVSGRSLAGAAGR
ncbi:MAG TPA: aldehyde dehydrogenase family protein [Terriglobales bacterium]|nr:aldehyde dehydrogenase family protein [Terriglobales bacterium]